MKNSFLIFKFFIKIWISSIWSKGVLKWNNLNIIVVVSKAWNLSASKINTSSILFAFKIFRIYFHGINFVFVFFFKKITFFRKYFKIILFGIFSLRKVSKKILSKLKIITENKKKSYQDENITADFWFQWFELERINCDIKIAKQ